MIALLEEVNGMLWLRELVQLCATRFAQQLTAAGIAHMRADSGRNATQLRAPKC